MKSKNLLLAILLMIFVHQTSYAAFPVKLTTATRSIETNSTHSPTDASIKQTWFAGRLTHFIQTQDGDHKPTPKKVGTCGLLSFIFGILGVLAFLYGGTLFSIAAIILGIIGIHHRKRFSRTGFLFSIIGLITGIIGLTFIVFVALIAG